MDFEHEIESLVVRSSALNCENANENNNHSDSNLKEPSIDPYENKPVEIYFMNEDPAQEIELESENNNQDFACKKVLDLKNCYEFMGISSQEPEKNDDKYVNYFDNQDQASDSHLYNQNQCTSDSHLFDQNQNAYETLKGDFGKNLHLVSEVENDSLKNEVKSRKRTKKDSSMSKEEKGDKISLDDLKKRMKQERINLTRKRNENEIKKYKQILWDMLPPELSVGKLDTLALVTSATKYCKLLEDQIENKHMEFMFVERRNFILKERIAELESYRSDQWPFDIEISSDCIRISKIPDKFVF